MLGENLSQERGLVEWAVCERGRGEVFGQAREGFMEEVSFYQKPIETRDLALQIFRKGAGENIPGRETENAKIQEWEHAQSIREASSWP